MTTPPEPPVLTLHEGTLPLLISMPHVGTAIPAAVAAGMTDESG